MRYYELYENYKFDGTITNEMYNTVLKYTEGGPFDGGCLLYAMALHKHFGGILSVVMCNNIAQHACVNVNNKYIDASGELSYNEIIANTAIDAHLLNKKDIATMYIREYNKKTDLLECKIPLAGVEALVNLMRNL